MHPETGNASPPHGPPPTGYGYLIIVARADGSRGIGARGRGLPPGGRHCARQWNSKRDQRKRDDEAESAIHGWRTCATVSDSVRFSRSPSVTRVPCRASAAMSSGS